MGVSGYSHSNNMKELERVNQWLSTKNKPEETYKQLVSEIKKIQDAHEQAMKIQAARNLANQYPNQNYEMNHANKNNKKTANNNKMPIPPMSANLKELIRRVNISFNHGLPETKLPGPKYRKTHRKSRKSKTRKH